MGVGRVFSPFVSGDELCGALQGVEAFGEGGDRDDMKLGNEG